MTHSLTLGSLLLTDSMPDDEHGFVFSVLADNASFGVASGVQEIVTSLLADGDLVRTRRYGNREVTFGVEITGPSLASLAQGEAALRREIGRDNTLTWQAPDIFAVPTVFEVVDSEMSQTFDDLAELRNRRTYTVKLTCSPFARSAELTTVSAMAAPGAATTVTVDTCDSAAGWTGKRNGVATGPTVGPTTVWEAGAVGIMELNNSVGFPPETWTMTRAGSVDFTTTPYLLVEVKTLTAAAGGPLQVTAAATTQSGASVGLPIIAASKIANGGGYFRVLFDATGTGVPSALTFEHTSSPGYGHAWQGLSVRNIARTNDAAVISARQLSRIIDVGGTERTPASMRAFTTSGYLGHTLLHTTPYTGAGYTPDLQRWRVSGNSTTTNASARKITGTWEALQPNSVVAEVPADQFPPGNYILIAGVKSSQTGERAVSWAVKSVQVNDVVVGNTTGTAYYAFEVADRLEYVPLGVVSAPSVRSNGALTVQIHLSNPSPGTTELHVEEWWMFKDGPNSALSIVGTDEANLYIESPDATEGVPRIWVGTGEARFHPNGRLLAQGSHTFPPGPMQVTTISDANDYLEVELSYYKRWHSNAAE